MTAQGRLDYALRDLADCGQQPPCAYDPEAWFEGSPEDRAHAAELCRRCPLLDLCAAVVAELPARLRIGVWAGVDYTAARAVNPRTQREDNPR